MSAMCMVPHPSKNLSTSVDSTVDSVDDVVSTSVDSVCGA